MSTNCRPAAVAGAFYPESPGELTRTISALLRKAPDWIEPLPKAVIAPHAGYIYSGPIAARAFAPLAGLSKSIRRVVLLGPTHRVAVRGLALPTSDAFATPLGKVPIDRQAADSIGNMSQVLYSDAAHAQEHSLEVEIPFLQMVLGDFALLPLAVGDASPEAVAEVLARLWGGEETLIVVSSDLSHYLPYEDARQIDAKTARQILALDPIINHYQACGATPVNGLLQMARQKGMHSEQLDLRNSGDTAGDRARVVGYGAFAFFGANPGTHHVH